MWLMSFDRLEELAKVVIWFDSARWSEENQKSFSWQPNLQLSASQEILTHWLTYITDMQRPWQQVWNVGKPVFREIVKAFSVTDFQNCTNIENTKREIQHFLDDFRPDPIKEGKVKPFIIGDLKYTPRYSRQHDCIERVLTILAYQYEKNFIKFIGESIKRWEQNPEGLRYLAHDLYLLTYSRRLNLSKTSEALVNKEKQKSLYSNWNRFGYKRLWAGLRDYRKMRSFLKFIDQGFVEVFGQIDGNHLYNIWTKKNNFGLNLLELPGDVWNIKFMQKIVKPLAENAGMKIKKSWGASYIARELAELIQAEQFYPEQFDVSFDLSAKACENGDCDLCPFGDSDLKDVCLSNTSAVGRKYCPVALATCQFRMICNTENCPVANGIGRNLCTK